MKRYKPHEFKEATYTQIVPSNGEDLGDIKKFGPIVNKKSEFKVISGRRNKKFELTTSLPGGGAKWVEFNPGEILVYDKVSPDGKVWFLFGDKKKRVCGCRRHF